MSTGHRKRSRATDITSAQSDLAALSPDEFALVKLVLEASYSDARDRVNSAERVADTSIRGMLVLNGAGIGTLITLLGFKSNAYGCHLLGTMNYIKIAVFLYIIGVGFSAAGAGMFSRATEIRSEAELAVAEDLLYRFKPDMTCSQNEEEQWESYDRWDSLAWILTAISFILFASGSLVALYGVGR